MTRQHHSCLAAVPPHTHGIYCSPQPAISSRSGSRLSKAHRVCPLRVGTLAGSVLLQGASFHPWVPAWGTVRVLCPVPPEGAAGVPAVLPGCIPAPWCRGKGAGSFLSGHRLTFVSSIREGDAGPGDGESSPDPLGGLQNRPARRWDTKPP